MPLIIWKKNVYTDSWSPVPCKTGEEAARVIAGADRDGVKWIATKPVNAHIQALTSDAQEIPELLAAVGA